MKVISYSLFKGPDPLAEIFYTKGFYFNVLMNTLVYNDWQTVVHVDRYTFDKYQDLFTHLIANYSTKVQILSGEYTHCEKMLWRMLPIFGDETEKIICRDSDALTSKREAQAVLQWDNEDLILHGINDNPAHSLPLMGGMCGFKAEPIRNLFGTWDNMLSKAIQPIDKHGSDQIFLNSVLPISFPENLGIHMSRSMQPEIYKAKAMWLLPREKAASDLCTSFIGAAGCNEFETLRFFRSHLPNWGSDKDLWAAYPKLFYWYE